VGNRYEGRDVVVTGGTGALGAAVVERLVGEGARVRVPCFHVRELERFPLADHERVEVVGGIDLAAEASAEGFFGGGPGALWASVHVAGGFAMGPLGETSLDDFRAQLRLNVETCFLACREAARRMGGGGRIVNVAARPALEPAGGMVGYTTAKAGVASMTRCLAQELKPAGILVNAVAPSVMDTPANRAAMPDADHAAWPTVEEVAATIAFLASPENTLTSGAIVPVYGRA
jgi:NAD(P)-dependent dehydrogenase (short-subunit alcohol dehydrogenase family)